MFDDFGKLAEYAGATSDPLALQLVTLQHNLDNWHATDADNKASFAAVDTSSGIGSVNPQNPPSAQDSGTAAQGS
jgi:hypothetical protein